MEEAQIVVDLEAFPLPESMQRELDKLRGSTNFTIFRTPHNISQCKKNLFEPSVISIGPFHCGQKHLQAMEEQKWRFLQDFLSRGDHISLDLCISEMKLLEERTRSCYSETFDDLDSNAFVKMMLLDGCFVLEYFLKLLVEQNSNFIDEVGWNTHFIVYDLVLLENQIPFFIVEKLMEIVLKPEDRMNLVILRNIFVKCLAYFFMVLILVKDIDSTIPDLPAEIPDTIDSISPDPTAEIPESIIPDSPAKIPNYIIPDPPAKIPDSIILDSQAEIPDSIIPDPPTEIPNHVDKVPDPPAEIPDSIIPDPPAEIPNPIDKIPDPPAEIHHLVHLCYHYLVPNPDIPVVSCSNSFDLARMFSTNRIKGLLHQIFSRGPMRRYLHSTYRSLSLPLPISTGNISSKVIPSATELKQKGLKFTPKSNPKHMLDISFEYGVLKISKLTISDNTKPIFANLIAFEHSKYGKAHSPFTSFVAFLDNLVNTPNDVTILQECGIIENWLGSEEEVTHFINHVTEFNEFDIDHYLADLYIEVNKYIGSSWNTQRAKLIRDYFSSPWATMSLIAALILLVLTLVQSFFAVFAYIRPPKP